MGSIYFKRWLVFDREMTSDMKPSNEDVAFLMCLYLMTDSVLRPNGQPHSVSDPGALCSWPLTPDPTWTTANIAASTAAAYWRRQAVGPPSWRGRPLHSVSSVGLVQWTVSALNSSYLTEYKTDFHKGFFAENVIHVAMIQDTCFCFFLHLMFNVTCEQ